MDISTSEAGERPQPAVGEPGDNAGGSELNVPKPKRVQARSWCFTSFEEAPPSFDPAVCEYLCYQSEQAGSTGRRHFQGMIVYHNKIALSTLKRSVGATVHFEPMRGTHRQAREYCQKPDTAIPDTFKEYGILPIQGRRADIEALHSDIKNGKTLFDLCENHFDLFLRYPNGVSKAKLIYDYATCPTHREVQVEVWYGPTGTGKSTELALKYPEAYFTTGGDLDWWDSYGGQDVLIIDEYYGQVKCTDLLSILQPIRKRLRVKGSFAYARWSKVFLTSNVPPWKWYKEDHVRSEVIAALRRRIHTIRHIERPWFERCRVGPRSDVEVGKPLPLQ